MEVALKQLLSPAGGHDSRSAAELLYSLRHEGIANLPVPMSVLVMIVLTAVFSGTLIACLEISTERSIYRRERMSYLHIGPYLASKLPFCMAMTGLQCLVFVAICWLHPILPLAALPPVWLAMVSVAWCSVAIGLLLSAVDTSGGRFSVMLAVAVVLPQLLLSGGLGPDYYARMGRGLQGVAARFMGKRRAGSLILCGK
jgi:ABC-type multidrug transport system permease subunit